MTELNGDTEKPPVFSSWNGWYGFVIGFLFVLIGLMYLFTKAFE